MLKARAEPQRKRAEDRRPPSSDPSGRPVITGYRLDASAQARISVICNGLDLDFVNIETSRRFGAERQWPVRVIGAVVADRGRSSAAFTAAARRAGAFVVFLDVTEDLQVSLAASACRALVLQAGQASRSLVVAELELADLRSFFDANARAFNRLEVYCQEHGLIAPTVRFALPPGTSVLSIEAGMASVEQALPVNACGLAGFELMLTRHLRGRLHMQVELLIGGSVAYTWIVENYRPERARLYFALPITLAELYHPARLRIQSPGLHNEGVKLRLAQQRTAPRWAAVVDQQAIDRPLSVKLWFAVPETRPAAPPDALFPAELAYAGPSRSLRAAPWGALSLRLMSHHLQHPLKVTPAGYLEIRLGTEGPVTIRLPGILRANKTKHVQCVVRGSVGATVEVALAADTPDPTPITVVGDGEIGRTTGWVAVIGGEAASLLLDLEGWAATDLIVAARSRDGLETYTCTWEPLRFEA